LSNAIIDIPRRISLEKEGTGCFEKGLSPADIIFSFHFYSLSQCIRPKVTVHKYEGIIRKRVLFKGGPYMRKYGRFK
jgi:hypothetical protein